MALQLYTFWRSSASYRVRIALSMKGLDYQSVPKHLLREGGEQRKPDYLAVNPQGLVPALVDDGFVIPQSVAICEYLEELYPAPPLLPGTAHDRATVRGMALAIACDIHPLNNLSSLSLSEKRIRGRRCSGATLGFALDPARFCGARELGRCRGGRVDPCRRSATLLLWNAGDAGRRLPGAADVQRAPVQSRPRRVSKPRRDRDTPRRLAGICRRPAGSPGRRGVTPLG